MTPMASLTINKEMLIKAARFLPYTVPVVGLAVLLAGYFLLIRPSLGDILAGGRLDLAPAQARLAESQTYRDKLDKAAKKLAELPSDSLGKMKALVPETGDPVGVFADFEDLAKRSGFVLKGVSTSLDVPADSVSGRSVIKVTVGISGGDYRKLKRFLGLLETFRRVYDIRSVSVGTDTTDYSLDIYTYYLDPNALEKIGLKVTRYDAAKQK